MPDLTRREKAVILAGLLAGLFMTAINMTSVTTAMPRIVAALGGMQLYSWVFTSYMLAFATMVPIFGKMSDLFGRRPIFVSGLALFTIASALNGAAQSMEQLVAFRAVQGLGAAAVMPLVMITMGDLFLPAERVTFQGIAASLFAISGVIGPLLGGLIVDHWSWRWVFFFNVPLGILTIFVAFFALRKLGTPSRKPSIDYLGMASLMAGVVTLLLGFMLGGGQYPWGSPTIIGLFAASAIMLTLFVLVERVAKEPIIPLFLFRNPIFLVSISAMFMTGIAMFGTMTFLPLLLQAVMGASATGSGLLMMPQSLGLMVSSNVVGLIIARTGYRTVVWVGACLTAIAVLALTLVGPQSPYELILMAMVVLGLGTGATFPTFTTIVQNAVEHAHIGIATSSMQFFQQVGGTLGVTLLGAVLGLRLSSAVSSAFPAGIPDSLAVAGTPGAVDPQALLDPEKASQIPPALLEVVRAALASSLQELFLLVLAATVLSFIICLFLREIPLRRHWQASEAVLSDSRESAEGA